MAIKKIIIAEYYGFCMGVKRAISIAEQTMLDDDNVTILNEIVHNDAIVDKFSKAGAGQSNSIDDVTSGTLIVSAHGASPEIFENAALRGLKIIDATCSLVINIHKIIKKLAGDGYHILHFGDPEHDETIGIVGHAPDKVTVLMNVESVDKIPCFDGKIALTSQTTAHISDFNEIEIAVKKKYPDLKVFNTICNATSQRQEAITELAHNVDVMLIVGSTTSANSKRLVQISKALCEHCYLINTADDIKAEWFTGENDKLETVGLSAGASTPDFLIEGAIYRLQTMVGDNIEIVYPAEKINENRLAIDINYHEI